MKANPARKDAILAYIKTFQAANGYPPTITEIGEALGLAKTTVHYHRKKMAEAGLLELRARSARGMKVL